MICLKLVTFPKILCFAHDTLLLYEIDKNSNDVPIEINFSFQNISRWFTSNLLLLNELKSNFMVYSNNLKKQNFLNLDFGNKIIKETDSFKYLGLNFVCNLKWNLQITHLLVKLKFFVR